MAVWVIFDILELVDKLSIYSRRHHAIIEKRVVLSMSRFFYCEEQSLEGIIICSSNIYFTQ